MLRVCVPNWDMCCIPDHWQPDANLLPVWFLACFEGGMSDLSSATGPCLSAATAPVSTPACLDSIDTVLFLLYMFALKKGNNDVNFGSTIVTSHRVVVWVQVTSIEGCNMLSKWNQEGALSSQTNPSYLLSTIILPHQLSVDMIFSCFQ